MKKLFDAKQTSQKFSKNKLEYKDECIEDSEKGSYVNTILRIQKKQVIDLKQHLKRYVNTSPVFGFNSGRYDLNLIKSDLIYYLIRDKEQETSVSKKKKISFP